MSAQTRTVILRANALYLLLASVGGLRMDVLGSFFASGPSVPILTKAPYTAVGFFEAHGLALIFSILLWRAAPLRFWHVTGATIHTLLGTANLLYWQIFIAIDLLWMGYLTTSLHWAFALLQFVAAVSARATAAEPVSSPV